LELLPINNTKNGAAETFEQTVDTAMNQNRGNRTRTEEVAENAGGGE